ncbi:MAG TPA: hypothetical protein VGG97_22330 [Bryobacteraceae bacterium]|jgi:hypothetical protein
MLRDVVDGIHSEIECTRMRAWAEETLPQIHLKLVNSLRKLNLEERPFVTEDSLPNNKVFYTRRERTWNTVRMLIPESRMPLMEVTVLGFTGDCGIKICFDRWLQRSCHESHFSLVLEHRREHRLIVVADKSVNSPFHQNVLELEEIVETLAARFVASLSMCGVRTAGQAVKVAGSAIALPR